MPKVVQKIASSYLCYKWNKRSDVFEQQLILSNFPKWSNPSENLQLEANQNKWNDCLYY